MQLLVLLALALAGQPSQAQQEDSEQQTKDPNVEETAPSARRGEEDPFTRQGSTSREELDLLWKLEDGGLQQPGRSSGGRRDPALEDLKSLMEEVDPRDSLSLDLPVIVDDDGLLESPSAGRGAAGQDGTPAAEGGGAAPAARGAAGSQRTMTVGEVGEHMVAIISDFRIYAYLSVALAVVLGAFGLAAVLRHIRARNGRSRHRRRRRHRHNAGLKHYHSRRSASRRRHAHS